MSSKYIKRTPRAEQALRNDAGSSQERDLLKALAQPLPYQALQNMFANVPSFDALVNSLERRLWLEWVDEEVPEESKVSLVPGYLPPTNEEVEQSLQNFLELMNKK